MTQLYFDLFRQLKKDNPNIMFLHEMYTCEKATIVIAEYNNNALFLLTVFECLFKNDCWTHIMPTHFGNRKHALEFAQNLKSKYPDSQWETMTHYFE